MNASYTYM